MIAAGKARTRIARARAAGSPSRGMRTSPAQYFSLGGVLKGIGQGIGGFLSGGPIGAVSAVLGGSRPTITTSMPSGCPPGFRMVAGKCQPASGLYSPTTYSTGTPAQPGQTLARGGQAVVGAFGMPAMEPDIVGVVEDRNGVRQPIRRCMAGMVLGKDDLCYPKQVLGRRGKWRKHPAPAKAPVTAEDAKAIRKAASAKNRVKKLAGDVGFTCKKR